LKFHCAGDSPLTDSSMKPRVTERWREAVVISSGVSPVSAMMVDEVLFTVPPWKRCKFDLATPEDDPASRES
jgi:hypothetical protein